MSLSKAQAQAGNLGRSGFDKLIRRFYFQSHNN
jgi:hypothetical protein